MSANRVSVTIVAVTVVSDLVRSNESVLASRPGGVIITAPCAFEEAKDISYCLTCIARNPNEQYSRLMQDATAGTHGEGTVEQLNALIADQRLQPCPHLMYVRVFRLWSAANGVRRTMAMCRELPVRACPAISTVDGASVFPLVRDTFLIYNDGKLDAGIVEQADGSVRCLEPKCQRAPVAPGGGHAVCQHVRALEAACDGEPSPQPGAERPLQSVRLYHRRKRNILLEGRTAGQAAAVTARASAFAATVQTYSGIPPERRACVCSQPALLREPLPTDCPLPLLHCQCGAACPSCGAPWSDALVDDNVVCALDCGTFAVSP